MLCLCALVHSGRCEQGALLPAKFKLTGPFSRQQLLLEAVRHQQFIGQITNHVVFTSSAPNVVRIDRDVAVPLTNGAAQITATSGEITATAEVSVAGMEHPFEWSFRNHVQPVLAKMGCSSGACHGAAAGQNGFKLSLRGYDNDGDYLTLTRHALGRRIIPTDPGLPSLAILLVLPRNHVTGLAGFLDAIKTVFTIYGGSVAPDGKATRKHGSARLAAGAAR